MIIDSVHIYHICKYGFAPLHGASLKELGRKWFFLILAGLHAFSRFDVGAFDVLGRLER